MRGRAVSGRVVLRARPLVIGRIGPCGALHWSAGMHLVHADSRVEAWRYRSPIPVELLFGGGSWDSVADAARMTCESGVEIARRQLAGQGAEVIVQAAMTPETVGAS